MQHMPAGQMGNVFQGSTEEDAIWVITADGNGSISATEAAAMHAKHTDLPNIVFDDRISGLVGNSDYKLYYSFLPKTGGDNAQKKWHDTEKNRRPSMN